MNPKVKLARKLLSKKEIKAGTPVFFSKGWSMRADAIKERVARKQGLAMKRAEQRRKVARRQKELRIS